MVSLNTNFNAHNVDPTQGSPQLPVGRHPVVISASDLKENSNKDGGFIEFTLTIIDGPAKGTNGAYRLNLYHTNPKTVEIAHKQLSALCHVTGVYQIDRTEQLHNIPFIIDVAVQNSEEGKAKGYTQVVKVYDRNMNEPGKASAAAPGGPGQPVAAAPSGASPGPGTWGQPPGGAPVGQPAAAQPQQSWAPPGGAPAGGQPQWQAPTGQPAQTVGVPAGGQPNWQQPNQGGNGGGQPNWSR